jgi:hypothetical protein
MVKIDWMSLTSKVRPETASALNAFRTRHANLLKTVTELREKDSQGINFDAYKALNNQKLVSDAKKALADFKPQMYDLTAQLKVIQEAEKFAVIFC